MDRPENQKRLESIFAQLVKISNGNFSYQIDRSDKDDVLEALAFLTNSATEEIKDAFRHQAFVNLNKSYQLIVQLFFELNAKGMVLKSNHQVYEQLGYDHQTLLQTPFTDLLTKTSKKGWKKLLKGLHKTAHREITVQLTFKENSGLELPTHCHVIGFTDDQKKTDRIIVTSFDMVREKGIDEKQIKKKLERHLRDHKLLTGKSTNEMPVLHTTDFNNFREAEKYILDHLDTPLPSIKELAHLCGTNEFKFKRGFKELFGSTPFQYQKHERLRRAHVLIENSNTTIGTIAKTVGFKKGNHLAREFKKKYGYSPTTLRKLSN